MNHELVGREVLREVAPFHSREFKIAADILLQPPRNLHAPDIFFDRMVRAGLCYQDLVAGAQLINRNSGAVCATRSPLRRDKRMENAVSGMESGVTRAT